MNENTPAEVHHPIPLHPPTTAMRLTTVHPHALPEVQTLQLPDGRLITGYALTPAKAPEPYREPRGINPLGLNIALGGIGLLAAAGGLLLLATFITVLTALVQQLIILAAVIFGGWIAVQALGPRNHRAPHGTTVNIRRAVFKRSHFHQ
ncbi:hypothetical protein [Streptomyces sp. WAC06614]|uniref:hypothetical protein n=1 Tax=Streptomyces sp. WAC06614 TaxID=2487416 RepID=UPI0026ADC26C|nr:hypothetical protein [Streptomyces sp. WAC06614]